MATVSIICPLYNKEKYISGTVESVIAQERKDWELLIIDDGSTDRSLSIIHTFTDERIKLFHRNEFTSKKGASVCRNIGIQKSSGQFILFLDADDLLTPFCLSYRLKKVFLDPNYDLFIFREAYFRNDAEKVLKRKNISQYKNLLSLYSKKDMKRFYFKRFASYDLPWTISNPLWRKSALVKLNGFQEDFQRLQDPEIHLRALSEDWFKLRSFLSEGRPDVLIRLDDDRRSINRIEHFKNHLSSVDKFLNYFDGFLAEKRMKCFYLQGYILSVIHLQIHYKHHYREALHLERSFDFGTDSYPFVDAKFRVVIKFLNFAGSSRLLRKLKVPSILVNAYKIVLWI